MAGRVSFSSRVTFTKNRPLVLRYSCEASRLIVKKLTILAFIRTGVVTNVRVRSRRTSCLDIRLPTVFRSLFIIISRRS